MQQGAIDQGAVAPCGGRTEAEGVENWMWEWREWRKVPRGEPCLAGLLLCMDLAAGTNNARPPDSLRARLDAAEAARGGHVDELPLAPLPPQPESPQAVAAKGEGGRAQDVAVENVEEEEEYGPGESTLALMYEDDAEPDVYVGMDLDPANAPVLPMPTKVPPPRRTAQRVGRPESGTTAGPPPHPSLGSIMAWGARHCATSATSASVSSPSSAVGSAATRK